MEDDDRFKFDGEEYYVKSSEEMRQLFPDDLFPNACDNTLKIADRELIINFLLIRIICQIFLSMIVH